MATNKTDLTIRDIAERTRMAETTVRSWVRSGKLPSRQIGPRRTYRVKVADLESFLDNPSR